MMNDSNMPGGGDLVNQLVALRDALVDTSQTLRELQFRMDQEGRKQAGDTVDQMLERFAPQPPAVGGKPAPAPSAG